MPLSMSMGTRESKMNPQVKENLQLISKSNSLNGNIYYEKLDVNQTNVSSSGRINNRSVIRS